MAKSTYANNAVLNAMFNNTAFQVAVPWISLHSANPGLTGTSELTGNSYGRVNASACFPAAGSSACNNDATITFPTASGNWTAATYFGVWDAETNGNFLCGGALTGSITCLANGTVSFAAAALQNTEA
jgi:hypothetical protein